MVAKVLKVRVVFPLYLVGWKELLTCSSQQQLQHDDTADSYIWILKDNLCITLLSIFPSNQFQVQDYCIISLVLSPLVDLVNGYINVT